MKEKYLYTKTIFRILVCVFFFCSPLSSKFHIAIALENNQQEQDISASHYLESAQEFYEQGQYQEALEAVKQALKHDKSLADAYNLQAEILLQGDSEYDWIQAEKSAQKAIELQRRNAQYHFTLGKVLEKQYSRYNAIERFKYAVKLDTTHVEAYYHLGILNHYEIYFYGGMVDVQSKAQLFDENMLRYLREYGSGGSSIQSPLYNAEMISPLSQRSTNTSYRRIIEGKMTSIGKVDLNKYSDNALENAKLYFTQALRIDSTHWQSLLQLGLLSFETKDLESLKEYAEKLEQLNIDDKDVHLFFGLAYNQLRDFTKAELAFQQALEHLSLEERFIYESSQYLLPATGPGAQDKENIIQQASAIDNEIFWKARDPFFLTADNERRLDHYGRCAYVHFRFSLPLRNIEGIRSDRGKVYIRYGEPLKVIRDRPAVHHCYERWYYSDRTFVFDDLYGDGRSGYDIRMPEMVRNEFQKTPEEYHYESEGEVFDIPCQIAGFRGSAGKTALEILYGIPIVTEDMTPIEDIYLASYNTGLFLFDRQWNDIMRETSLKSYISANLVDSNLTDLMTDITTLEIEPGPYHFSLELENEFSKNTGIFRDTLKVDSYEGDSLMLSDILVAMDIQPLVEPLQSRDDLKIFANPTLTYKLGKELHLYYEIYNLSIKDEVTTYGISTAVSSRTLPKKGLDWVYSGVKGILGFNPPEAAVTTYYEYQGNSETELQRSILDIRDLGVGAFILSVTIEDLNTGQEASKSVEFQIRER